MDAPSPASPRRRAGTEWPVLRPGGPRDAEGIASLIERANRRPADTTQIGLALATAPSVVAIDGDELVGFIYGRQFAPDVVHLQNALVAPRWQRQGVGRQIFAMAEKALRDEGYRAAIGANSLLHHGAIPQNCAAARSFWLRMGFRVLMATGGTVVLGKWLGAPVHGRDHLEP